MLLVVGRFLRSLLRKNIFGAFKTFSFQKDRHTSGSDDFRNDLNVLLHDCNCQESHADGGIDDDKESGDELVRVSSVPPMHLLYYSD